MWLLDECRNGFGMNGFGMNSVNPVRRRSYPKICIYLSSYLCIYRFIYVSTSRFNTRPNPNMKIHTMESRKADEKPDSEGKSEGRSWNSFD